MSLTPRTLAGRIRAVLITAIVVPTMVLGLIAVRETRATLTEDARQYHLGLVTNLAQNLNTLLQESRRSLDVAAMQPMLLASGTERTRLLGTLARHEPLFRSVYLLDTAGKLVEAAGALPGLRQLTPTSWGGYVTDSYRSDDGTGIVTMILTVRDRGLRDAGYLCADIDLAFVSEVLSQMPVAPTASVLVVDANRQVIATRSPLPAKVIEASAAPAIDRVSASLSPESITYRDGEGREWLAAYRNMGVYDEFRGLRWSILVEQETRDAFALARKTAQITAAVALVFVVFGVVAGGWMADQTAASLSRLGAQADRVAEGQTTSPIYRPGMTTEIGHLARRLDEMAARITASRIELARQADELVKSEKLSSVGVLAAGVAHEVNNPLTAILGYSRLLVERSPAGDPDRPALELIASEAERVQVIVRSLLDFSQPAGEAFLPVDVNAAVGKILAVMAVQFRQAGVEVTTALGPDLPTVKGDEGRIQQVLVNLARNAIDAMSGGPVSAASDASPVPRGSGPVAGRVGVATCARAGGKEVVIEVTDSGPGIPPEILGRIFDPFFTTKGGRGTGLGLSISHGIAREHGGSIEVESQPGHGATFRLVLPAGGTQ